MEEFIDLCKESFSNENTDFISKKNSYELGLCQCLNSNFVERKNEHYYDLIWKNKKRSYFIEVKKSQSGSFWIPEVRSAEMILSKDIDLSDHYTMLIRFKKNQILAFAVIPTKDFLNSLNIDEKWAHCLIERNNELLKIKRQIHCQQSYNWKNVSSISNATVVTL